MTLYAKNSTTTFEFDELDYQDGSICYYHILPTVMYQRTPGTLYLKFDEIEDAEIFLWPSGEYDGDNSDFDYDDFAIKDDDGDALDFGEEAEDDVWYEVNYL